MKKILITGASGFLAWHLSKELVGEYELHGLYFRQNFELEGLSWHRFNLLEEKKIPALIKRLQPDLIVHLAAIANVNFCEEHPALSHHINVYSTVALAEVASELDIPLIFSSTDLVFNGNAGPYAEDDFPYPLSVYGGQKLAAEETLLAEFEQTMILRLPLLFGVGPDYSKNFFKQWVDSLRAGNEIMAFTDEFRTTLSGAEAARGIGLAIRFFYENYKKNKNIQRLFHISGSEIISRFHFAKLLSSLFELDDSLILPKLRSDLEMSAARPENVALNGELAAELIGFRAVDLASQILALKKEMT